MTVTHTTPRKRDSLLARLLLTTSLTVTLAVGGAGYFVYDELKDRLIETNKESIAQLAHASEGVLDTLTNGESSGLDREALQGVARMQLLGEKASDGTRDYSDSNFVWGEDGYLYAYNDDGVALMHPFLEGQDVKAKNPTVIKGLLDTAEANPDGSFYEYAFIDPDGNERDKISYVYQYEPWDWTVGIAVYEDELYAGIGNIALLVTLGTLLVTVLINLIIWLAISRPLKTINRLVGNLEQMADGDLGVDVEPSNERSEIGRLARTVAHLKTSLAEMLGSVDKATREVASSSDGLRIVTTETSRATGVMASHAASIQDTVGSQTHQIEGISTSVRDISQTMTHLSDKLMTFSEGVSESTDDAIAGKDTIHEAASGLADITASVTATERAVTELQERARSIQQVTGVIADISDRTKMLALNAQIEAARAGEQGRGFAVVATEVGNLALSTRESVAEIRDLIQHVERAMNEVTTLMQETEAHVATGNGRMSAAEDAFGSIVTRFAAISETLQDITANVEQVTAQTEEAESGLDSLVDDAQSIREMTTGFTADVNRLREQAETVESVGDTLTDASNQLNDSIRVFRR